MKKILLFIAIFIFITVNVNSQIEQGNWMVGGSGSFQHNVVSVLGRDVKYTTINLIPDFAYFMANRLSVGTNISWTYQHVHDPSSSSPNSSYSGLTIGPFARYYFLKNENLVNIFGQAQYQHFLYRANGTTINNNSNSTIFSLGSSLFLNSSIGIELTANYQFGSSQGEKQKEVSINIGFQIYLETEKNYNKHH